MLLRILATATIAIPWTLASVFVGRLLRALGLVSPDPKTAHWTLRQELQNFLLRKFLALSNITRPAPTAPPKRHRLTGTSRPRGLDTQVDWSTVRIPRRKFDRDPLHGLGDPIEAEIIESAGLSGVRKEEHTVVLNFHGGSFTMGDPTQVRGTDIEFAKLLLGNAKCVSSSYRLAPAEKYPCALHDAVSAYLWLIEDQNYSSSQIILAGISAGGNIACTLALYSLQNNLPLPKALAVFTPTMDLTNSAPSRRTAVSCILPGPPLDGVTGEDPYVLHPYVSSIEIATNPLVSPLYAKTIDKRHPPVWLQTGDVDRLQDEVLLRFVQLAKAGVPVQCEVYGGGTHIVASELAFNKQAKRIHEEAAGFIGKVIKGEAVETELVFVDGNCKVKDLGGVEGAKSWLQKSLEVYAKGVKGGKERIKKGWARFGFLKVWEGAAGPV